MHNYIIKYKTPTFYHIQDLDVKRPLRTYMPISQMSECVSVSILVVFISIITKKNLHVASNPHRTFDTVFSKS